MSNIRLLLVILVFTGLSMLAWSCNDLLPDAPESEELLAEPMSDLTNEQVNAHIIGDEKFGETFSEERGLGPVFVSNSCESCHIGDGKGHPITTLTRFGRYEDGTWDPLTELGGPQQQGRSIENYPPEKIPDEATGVTKLMPPAVTGLGFLEAVPDSTLLALADPNDEDGDGISGRVNLVEAPDFFTPEDHHLQIDGKYIGRFGKKASTINLLHQTVVAYKQDMGITSDFDTEDIYNPEVGPSTGDDVDDPEISASTVLSVVFYLQTLKVPPRRNENDPDVQEGREIFDAINCSSCHIPTLKTGESDIGALENRTFHPYSDMLLHDMGNELNDGYIEASDKRSEWRTAPLWGIGLAETTQGGQTFFLHDGRAETLDEAIQLHGGEAAQSRQAYRNLSDEDQQKLITFLESL